MTFKRKNPKILLLKKKGGGGVKKNDCRKLFTVVWLLSRNNRSIVHNKCDLISLNFILINVFPFVYNKKVRVKSSDFEKVM